MRLNKLRKTWLNESDYNKIPEKFTKYIKGVVRHMPKKKRNNITYPKWFMKIMKKKKNKKIRNTPIYKPIKEQYHNDAERII